MTNKKTTTLLQPNNVTFSCKTVSALQYNILVLIVEKLQKYMTRDDISTKDIIKIPEFRINASEVCDINHKDRVLEAADDMTNIDFTFTRMDWDTGKRLVGKGPLITWIDDVKGTDEIRIKLNDMLIPAMTYCGEGVGGTYFVKEQTLKDASVYTKQIRQMIKSWKNLDFIPPIPLEEFKQILGVKASLSNHRLKVDILEPSRTFILSNEPNEWFEYELYAKEPIPGRKPKADHIKFKVYSKDATERQTKEKYENYRRVYNCITRLAPAKAVEYTDKITEMGKLSLIASKWVYYSKCAMDGEITRDYMDAVLRKILAEECGIIILKKF